MTSIRLLLSRGEYDPLTGQLRQLRAAISHKYESFFRVSQIDKSWKALVIEECRRYLDRSLGLLELAPAFGHITAPDSLSEVPDLFAVFRSPAPDRKSYIPRPRPPESPTVQPLAVRMPGQQVPAHGADSDSDLSDDAFFSAHDKPPVSPIVGRLAAELADIDAADAAPSEELVAELLAFEGKFARYVAATATSDLLSRFMNELRVTQRLIQTGAPEVGDHFARLAALMRQVHEKVPVARPLFQYEARFEALARALAAMRAGLADGAGIEELAAAAAARWQAVQDPGGARRDPADRMAATVAAAEGIARGPHAARARIVAEMRVVQARIGDVRRERGVAAPAEGAALDAEFAALMEQQADLAERLAALG
jgi:hypothetical protein